MVAYALHVNSYRWLFFMTNWSQIFSVIYFLTSSFVSLLKILEDRRKHLVPSASLTMDETNSSQNNIKITIEKNVDYHTALMDKEQSDTIDRPAGNRFTEYFFKFNWLMFNLSLMCCTGIVFLHWAFIQDYSQPIKFDVGFYLLVETHGTNLLLIWIHFFICNIPIRIMHFMYVLIVSVIYVVINVTYWYITKDAIYDILDYAKNPIKATFFILGGWFVLVPIQQILYFLAYKMKLKLSS